MNPTDEELEVELEDEPGQEQEQEGDEGGDQQPQPNPEADALRAEIAALKARPEPGNAKLDTLIELGTRFFQSQGQPKADPEGDKRAVADFGRKLKEVVLTGDDEQIGQFMLESVNSVAQRTVNERLSTLTPATEKAGDYAVQMFLMGKKDDAEGSGRLKIHQAVAKNFETNERERAWLATASASDGRDYLERKYTEAAGKLVVGPKAKVSPRSMGEGGRRGEQRGDNVVDFPGMDRDAAARYEAWAVEMFPDPKRRAEVLKTMQPKLRRVQGE